MYMSVYVCMYACMHVCMYVHLCIYFFKGVTNKVVLLTVRSVRPSRHPSSQVAAKLFPQFGDAFHKMRQVKLNKLLGRCYLRDYLGVQGSCLVAALLSPMCAPSVEESQL